MLVPRSPLPLGPQLFPWKGGETCCLDPAHLLPQDLPSPGSAPTCPCLAPKGSIYLNDFARVVSSDHQAVNGILHFIDRVLLPPDVLHWEPEAAPTPRVWHGPGSSKTGGWGLGIVSPRLTSLLTSAFP